MTQHCPLNATRQRLENARDWTAELRDCIEVTRARLEESRRVLGDHPRVVSFADLFQPPRRPR